MRQRQGIELALRAMEEGKEVQIQHKGTTVVGRVASAAKDELRAVIRNGPVAFYAHFADPTVTIDLA